MQQPTTHPVRAGLHAAKANIGPGIILWVMGAGVLLAYYCWPAGRVVFDRIAELKQSYGFVFSMISTAVFGAVIPVLVQQLRPKWRHSAQLQHLPYLILFWAIKGIEVDLLYRGQAWLFGNDTHVSTLAIKAVVDQFVYVPIWAAPTLVLGYLFKDCGYSIRQTWRQLGPRWYIERGLPLMIANWGVWVPTVICIYCMPLPLQLPIQNLVLCLWSLMLLLILKREETDQE